MADTKNSIHGTIHTTLTNNEHKNKVKHNHKHKYVHMYIYIHTKNTLLYTCTNTNRCKMYRNK